MRLLSINIGVSRQVQLGERTVTTGILKQPTAQATIGELGLQGDIVADKKNHGGPDQAVYLYAADDYAWWSERLGFEVPFASFGENLTLSGFGSQQVRVGDRFRVGEVLLEATAPRIPCAVLANHMQDPEFVKKFRQAERPGVYARVIEGGTVRQGDGGQWLPTPHDHPSLLEIFRMHYHKSPTVSEVLRLLEAPVAARFRSDWQEWLQERG